MTSRVLGADGGHEEEQHEQTEQRELHGAAYEDDAMGRQSEFRHAQEPGLLANTIRFRDFQVEFDALHPDVDAGHVGFGTRKALRGLFAFGFQGLNLWFVLGLDLLNLGL